MLEWMGKQKVLNHHNEVPFHVLKRKWGFVSRGGAESFDRIDKINRIEVGDSNPVNPVNPVEKASESPCGNMIIHGDNLVALKSLLPQYEGRVKCIYIDPPYNTGNEGWVYNDNVNDPQIKKWLNKVVGKEGEDFSRHDKWLCMMYPRLKLLQKLLSQDGAIFISIDDNEYANLKLVCDEIFGERNKIQTFIWRKVDSPPANTVPVVADHEYILSYAKDRAALRLLPKEAPDIVGAYGGRDEEGRPCRDRLLKKNGKSSLRKDRPTMWFGIKAPDGTEVFPIHDNGEEARWSMGKEKVEELLSAGKIIWKRRMKQGTEVWEPYTREYPPEMPTRPYPTIWNDLHTMRQAKAQLREMFNTADLFDTPKPVNLIERILQMIGDKDAIVLDSFAGSGTTAHAVLNANAKDGGTRRFVLIEMCDYAETVTAERVKRAMETVSHGGTKSTEEGTDSVNSVAPCENLYGFGFYELGPQLMSDGVLNEDVPTEKIREYVWYTETRGINQTIEQSEQSNNSKDPYLLGVAFGVAYYFCYEKDKSMTLNRSLLKKIKTKAESYVIYADACTLSPEELEAMHIVFKKIPRDVTRF